MAKLILELPDQTEQTLNALANERHVSVGELLRQAVSLYRLASNSTSQGLHLALVSQDAQVRAIINMRETGDGNVASAVAPG